MSAKNRRRKAKEGVAIRDTGLGDLQVKKTIRHMIYRRLRLIVDGAVECSHEDIQMTQLAQWLFQEASASQLRTVAKAIKNFELMKAGDLDSRIAKESYLEIRAARARMRGKNPTLAEVRNQVLRNC